MGVRGGVVMRIAVGDGWYCGEGALASMYASLIRVAPLYAEDVEADKPESILQIDKNKNKKEQNKERKKHKFKKKTKKNQKMQK